MRQPYRPSRFRRPTGSAGRADAVDHQVEEPASTSDELEIDDLFGAFESAPDEIVAIDLETGPAVQDSIQVAGVAPVDMRMPADLVTSDLRQTFGLSQPPVTDIILRPYQEDAIRSWTHHDGRGVIVLPTGAGKTVVALGIAAQLGLRTLVVVPTIELLQQWRQALADRLGYPLEDVGIVGGGKRTVRDVTVITYDSAAMPHRRLDGFGLFVVDEVHHLPARAYRSISGKVNAPFRLGLSATPERSDDGHIALDHLIGPIVFRRTPAELARDRHIAEYDEKRLFVDLTADERMRYDQLMAEYRFYLASRRGSLGRPEGIFVELIRRSGTDPAARSALRAHHQARMIALNAEAKIAKVEELLRQHRDDKVIVFSEYNAMVDILSHRLLLPSITYRTHPTERRAVLDGFRSGKYSKLVTGRVLNEGVDVPDANVAIVVSGSSATREYIQRLGRVLRPKSSRAKLYELVSRKTTEGRSVRKRRGTAGPTEQLATASCRAADS